MERETILAVDDEPAVCELLREFLEGRGYTVLTASNGAEALTIVEKERPQLILLDLLMPGMNGLEVLQRIGKIHSRARIVMLTAVGDVEVAERALRRGAFDYITKPVDLRYLELAILTALAQLRKR